MSNIPPTAETSGRSLMREPSLAVRQAPRRVLRQAATSSWKARWWLGIAMTVILVHLVHPVGLVGDISYLAAGIGAAVAAWIGVTRAAGSWNRAVGRLVALGVSLSAAGDLTYQVFFWFGSEPDVSVADIFWLGSYIAISTALLRMLRHTHERRGAFRDGLVDVAVICVVVSMIEWAISVDTLVTDASSPAFSRVVWALYPACDALLIALVLRVVSARQQLTGATATLAGGALLWLLSDFTYLVTTASGALGLWQDIGWLVGAALLAASTWQRPEQTDMHPVPERSMGLASVALGLLPLMVPGVVDLLGWHEGVDANPIVLLTGTGLLLALVFFRAARLLHLEANARALLSSRERYASAVAANSSDAVVVLGEDRRLLNDGSQFALLMGLPDLPTLGSDMLAFATPVDRTETENAFNRAVSMPGRVFEAEFEVTRADGRRMWLGTRIVNLLKDPDVAGVVVNVHDATHRKQAEQELAHQAFHDSLTGLPNRSLFRDRVEQALRRDRRTQLDPAIVFLDLDGFKAVNDSLGHEAGDQVLCEVASRLEQAVRSGDTVTRLGGDEFAILIEQSMRPLDEAEEVSRRVRQALEVPLELTTQPVSLTVSIGIAVADHDSTASSLLRDADVAMYQAKRAGKGRYVIFEPMMRAAAVERLRLETELVSALEANQFRLDYQPVVSLATGRITGFEALLRWHHPALGIVPPDKFIPIAEDTGLIVAIGSWVLDTACEQAAEWRRMTPDREDLSIAVNVSGRQIASPALIHHVEGALARSGLPPAAVILELTETVLVQDPNLAAQRLQELRQLGVRLAVDDFGTGYSSLSYLRQFPFDILKIDRSFVATITDHEAIPAIVRGLLDLGRTLGLETVAEGVELEAQRDVLRAHGCDLAQGYLFARPLTPEAAQALLAQVLLPVSPVAG
jgi:diguanylate cyclase (GGDEF)-like protein/PAS domain S-box-containing protein